MYQKTLSKWRGNIELCPWAALIFVTGALADLEEALVEVSLSSLALLLLVSV